MISGSMMMMMMMMMILTHGLRGFWVADLVVTDAWVKHWINFVM
jgi:hypothetical protein